MNTKNLREAVAKAMADLDLTQNAFARDCGVPQSRISSFLHGGDLRSGHVLRLLSWLLKAKGLYALLSVIEEK